jgi:hypothetical protein
MKSEKKSRATFLQGSLAIFNRPVAFRPCLTAASALSYVENYSSKLIICEEIAFRQGNSMTLTESKWSFR